MSRFDLVIFGATGFTGKKAVEEIARVAKKNGVTWAIAGRSQSKLEKVIADVSKKIGEDLSPIKLIIADVGDAESLKSMCSQARVLVNCCGPYRLYGEPLVKAAIENKAHYVDVSGEPQFLETMQLMYDEAARNAGVYVISACGLDSIPNDMGVIFLQQQFDGTLNSVESYLSADLPPQYLSAARSGGVIHYGTWESLVYSLGHMSELGPLRRKLYPEALPPFKPKLQPRSALHKNGDGWCLPFPGADRSVVYRTQRYLYEKENKRPVQFKPYIKFPSLLYAILTAIGAVILFILSQARFMRNLLLNNPRLFSLGMVSREGPKDEVMDITKFTVELNGVGWETGEDVIATSPKKKLTAKVSGMNPGYGATTTMLIFSALTILKEQDKMPANGGVLTTGAAFHNTSLIQRLNENNVKFEVVEAK